VKFTNPTDLLMFPADKMKHSGKRNSAGMVPGSSATAATSTSPSKVSFTDNDRDVVRKRS